MASALVTTARCLHPGCGWSAAGPWADVDKAAAHTEKPPKHATSTETRAT